VLATFGGEEHFSDGTLLHGPVQILLKGICAMKKQEHPFSTEKHTEVFSMRSVILLNTCWVYRLTNGPQVCRSQRTRRMITREKYEFEVNAAICA
jgi:hypothetical protein